MALQLAILILVLILLVMAISRWNWHPFVALLLSALGLGLLMGLGGARTVTVLLDGFSNTMKWIAIVVILGAFIGEVLSATGGAVRIANAVVKRTGNKSLPWAMGITGYVISIPVFVDVAYIVLQPVTEALAARSKKPILVVGLALTAGLTVSHTLIPPTPGPLAVASLLGADIARLLVINGWVGLMAMAGGIVWVSRYCRDCRIPYDDKLATRVPAVETDVAPHGRAIFFDIMPILVPILLMMIGTCFDAKSENLVPSIVRLISTPMIAVSVGAGIAALQFTRRKADGGLAQLVDQAIVKSALVLMITGAGGAFGSVIKESGVQVGIAEFFMGMPFLGFMLPFVVAAMLTTATGSITVSLIGTASLLAPLVGSMPYSPEIMAALIGCGSFCVFHANASFFWLLQRLHEVPVKMLYRTYTPLSLVMGVSGLVGVLVLRICGVK